MAGELIRVLGTTKTLEANGASTANNAITQADDADYSVATDGAGYDRAKIALSVTFSVAPTEGAVIGLYARPLNVDGTNDAEIPEAARPFVALGVAPVNNVTTTQYIEVDDIKVPDEFALYIHNNGTGQTISAGWTAKIIPKTVKPAA